MQISDELLNCYEGCYMCPYYVHYVHYVHVSLQTFPHVMM